MNVVYASDDNYIHPLLVSLSSLKAHNPHCHITVLSNNLSHQNLARLSDYGVTVVDICMPVTGGFKFKYFNDVSYARLLIPSLIDVDRCLYLDCDTLITGDLSKLESVEVDIFGAVGDLHENECIRYIYSLTGKKLSRYFNSGVLVMNVAALRGFDLYGESLSFLGRHSQCMYVDQDAINFLFNDRITAIDERFNYQDHMTLSALTDQAIIHFTGEKKPWNKDYPTAFCSQLYGEQAELVSQ